MAASCRPNGPIRSATESGATLCHICKFWYIKLRHAFRAVLRAPARRAVHELYLVKSLVHASEVLWAFQQPGETLRLRDVMDRTGFGKGMCFRLLYTLRHCGFIEKVENNRYRLTVRDPPPQEVPDRLRRRRGRTARSRARSTTAWCAPPSASRSS